METKVYYWNVKKNFGDLLTPLLLKRFSNLDSVWADPCHAQVVGTGSILEHLPYNFRGIVAGCGKLHEDSVIILPNAKVLAVRGYLTAKTIKGRYVIADPGLLADELVGDVNKEHDLGIIPHWRDDKLEHNPLFKKYNPKIIRVGGDPLQVIKDIKSCRKIVSSALHGVILADACGVPRRIEIPPKALSHPKQEGGLFKWKDYLSSINMKLEIGLTQSVSRNLIIERQHELFDVFREIKVLLS